MYFERFFPFFNGHFRAQIVRQNETVELRFVDCGSLNSSTPITDYILVSVCSMVRRKFLASGVARDPIIGIGLSRAPAADAHDYEQAFRTQVQWSQSFETIQLDSQLFVAALTPGNQELEKTLVDLLIQTQLNSEPTLLEQLGDYLIEDLSNANWQHFCTRHRLLERTAARRLKALGWTFSELVEEYRRYTAEDLLKAGKLELVEISDRLGYSDMQSFSRACLRWFGRPPGMYRVLWANPK